MSEKKNYFDIITGNGQASREWYSIFDQIKCERTRHLAENLIREVQGIHYIFDLVNEDHIFPDNRLSDILGYSTGHLNPLTKSLLEQLMHPEDFSGYDQIINELKILANGAVKEFSYRLQSADGNWKWFQSRLLVLDRNTTGEVITLLGVASDVTTIMDREEKLLMRKAQLSALLESSTESIFAVDRDLCFIYFNTVFRERFKHVCGYYPEKGMQVFEGLTREKADAFKTYYDKALNGENVKTQFETLIDGKPTIREMHIFPSWLKNEIAFLTVFVNDITRYVLNERNLNTQKQLLHSIIESTRNSIFAFDKNLRYLAFNHNHINTMKKIYGVDIGIGMCIDEVLAKKPDQNRIKQYLLRALNGETFSIIEKYGLQDLHQFYYEVSFSPILDMDGQITGVSVFSVNISEKMESARQKLLAEKKFAELFEHSPDAVFVEDGSGTILDVNVAACKIQGRTKEELKGVNIRDLVPKENYCSILRDYKSLFLGASKQLESVIWTPDRGPVPVEITGNRISYDDQAALLIHLRDISERKKLEQERLQINIEKVRQKEELIRRSLLIKEQERSRIATEIHDDIGAGLSKISVICQVIKQLPNDPSTVSNHIDKIMQSSREVQENINEIIWAMNPQNDNLENLVAYLNYYASEYLESNILNFSFHLQSELPAIPVVGKVRRNIFLIVKESLHNIVKYAGPCDVNLKVQFENGAFRLEVLDNGNGFDMQVVSRFKNGIKNMYNRATDISGTFELNSSPGTGTSLVLTVPLMELF